MKLAVVEMLFVGLSNVVILAQSISVVAADLAAENVTMVNAK